MNNKALEEKIKQAFENSTPNVIDLVLSECKTQKGSVNLMTQTKRKKSFKKWIISSAAVFVFIVAGIAGIFAYNTNYSVASTVSLDVNPSIEIKVNQKQKVLDVLAHNSDGKKVLGDMKLSGNDLDIAVNAIIGSMLKNGYISELSNSILLSVDGNSINSEKLQEELSDRIKALLNTSGVGGCVLSQIVKPNKELKSLADSYGITLGKAKLINKIITSNTAYSFESLVPLSINELNLISKPLKNNLSDITLLGTASDKAYIGEAAAKKTALGHSGVSEQNAKQLEAELDWEKGIMVYEVEFKANGYEYDYDINALTGEIVFTNKKTDNDNKNTAGTQGSSTNDKDEDEDKDNDKQGQVNTEHDDDDKKPTAGQNTSKAVLIGKEKAKSIVLAHSAVAENSITGYKVKTDTDNGISIYEIEFKSGDYEYDYDINAVTGAIIKSKKDLHD